MARSGAIADRRRILLVRLDGLGDALTCVPALEGLRSAMPDARFGAICSDANAGLFARTNVENVHVFRGIEDEPALIAELRSASYTDALVATEEPAGYVLARKSGARRRAGFWHRFEKTFKSLWQYSQLTDAVYRPAAWVEKPEHEVSAIYRLAESVGALRPIPDDPGRLRSWIDIKSGGIQAVGADAFAWQIAPKLCANGWTPAAIASCASAALAAAPFRRCVFLAAASDMNLARAVMEEVPQTAAASGGIALAPPAGLAEWLGAIASAGALVTPDTGAAHAAGMLGVPVVDLFEPERFDQLRLQWRPWAAPSRCLEQPPYSAQVQSTFGTRIGAALEELVHAAGVVS